MEQDELLRHAIGLLDRLRVPYMLVGSLASGVWGEPRLTQDIDIVIVPTPAQIGELCASFPEEFYVSEEAAQDALRRGGQFNVLDPGSGNKIVFMIAGADAWGKMQLARREKTKILPDREGYAARPEDIILSKMLYYREGGSEKHLRDITGILKISGEQVDQQDVKQWAEAVEVSEIWEAILARLRQ